MFTKAGLTFVWAVSSEYHEVKNDLKQALDKIEVLEQKIQPINKPVMLDLNDPTCRTKLKDCGESLNRFAHYHIKSRRVNM